MGLLPYRLHLFKIVAVILVLLIFLQYMYLYPAKLNLSYAKAPSYSSELSLKNSLFYFKLGSATAKRSPQNLFSTEVDEEFVSRNSANTNESKPSSGNIIISSNQSQSSNASLDESLLNNSSSLPKFLLSQEMKPSPSPSKAAGTVAARINSTSDPANDSLSLCPTRPPTLLGNVRVTFQAPSLTVIGRSHSDLALGGRYKPPNCRSKDRVAIIVPFRDREEHLRIFLFNLLPFLKRQQIEFNIFVIEQGSGSKDEPFNRAMLFNVGFVEANKRGPFDCFIFHDVDLLPENDYNMYNCPSQPRHMSVAVDKMKYQLPYRTLFGGISALTREHFIKVNGFSNSFWGWGAEDDDMAGRIAYNGLYISRPPPNIARYKMLKHKQQKLNTQRYRMLQKGKQRFKSDGLSNLKYQVEQIVLEKTYTLIRIQLEKP